MAGNREKPVADFNVKTLNITDGVYTANVSGPAILNEAATGLNPPLIPNRNDVDTGIGWNATDVLSLIAGGRSGLLLEEASDDVIWGVSAAANVGLTADSGSAQGNGVITATWNVYDTVATAGDAATLPAAFSVGTIIFVKNGAAANSMDVFPASGDDLGAGANTALAVAAKDYVAFIGTTANSIWEQILTGTCAA